MKAISDIQKAATSDLVAAQNEAWISLVCDGYDTAIRAYLCAIEKELKKRINNSTLTPITGMLSLDDAVKRWDAVSTMDDQRVVDEIAGECKSYLTQSQPSCDFEAIAKHIAAKYKHEIYCDDVEVALAKLIDRGEIQRDRNRYHIA